MTVSTPRGVNVDPDLLRKELAWARHQHDDDLEYQLQAIEHAFWMERELGVDYGAEYLGFMAARQRAARQALAERARHGYRYRRPGWGYEREYIDDLKRRVPILDIIGNGVKLRRQGRNYVGLCPFHSERTPSFTVYPETNSYYCFGCRHYGDALDWLRQIAGLEFRAAVEALEVLAGVEKRKPGVGARSGIARAPITDNRFPPSDPRSLAPFVFQNGEVQAG